MPEIPRAAIDAGCALSTTGRGNHPEYRRRIEDIIAAALPHLGGVVGSDGWVVLLLADGELEALRAAPLGDDFSTGDMDAAIRKLDAARDRLMACEEAGADA